MAARPIPYPADCWVDGIINGTLLKPRAYRYVLSRLRHLRTVHNHIGDWTRGPLGTTSTLNNGVRTPNNSVTAVQSRAFYDALPQRIRDMTRPNGAQLLQKRHCTAPLNMKTFRIFQNKYERIKARLLTERRWLEGFVNPQPEGDDDTARATFSARRLMDEAAEDWPFDMSEGVLPNGGA